MGSKVFTSLSLAVDARLGKALWLQRPEPMPAYALRRGTGEPWSSLPQICESILVQAGLAFFTLDAQTDEFITE